MRPLGDGTRRQTSQRRKGHGSARVSFPRNPGHHRDLRLPSMGQPARERPVRHHDHAFGARQYRALHPLGPRHQPPRTRTGRSHPAADAGILRSGLRRPMRPSHYWACVASKKRTFRPKSARPASDLSSGGRSGPAAGMRSASAATPAARGLRAVRHKKARDLRADFPSLFGLT